MKKHISVHKQWTSTKIVLIYLFFGCLWILLSDKILVELVQDKNTLTLLQTYKGWVYVFVTAVILYALIQRGIRRAREIEAARLETGRRYDELVENASDGIFTLDAGGNFTAVNRAVEKITGYSREEILKLNFADLLAPENRDYVSRLLDPQNTQNPISVREVKIIRKDDRTAFLEISSRPSSSKDNRADIENIARDITQRRLIQAALQESETKYKKLIEVADEGIWTVDADFRVTLVNTKMCELLGFSADEIVGKSMLDFVDQDLRKKSEDNLERRRKGIREQVDFRFTRPDGSKIWVIVSSNPIFQNGEFAGVLYMTTDITERKIAEKKMRESEERFRVLFERSAVGAMIVGEDGEVIDCNEIGAATLGYTCEELKKLTVFDFDATLSPEELSRINEKVSRSDKFQFETRHRTKTGEIKNVLVVPTNLQINGKECHFASFFDITDKKQAEEALRREKERLEKIAASSPGVIHSFRLGDEGKPFFSYASPAIYEIYGKKPEELEKNDSVILEMTHPDDAARLTDSIKKSAAAMSFWHNVWRVSNPLKGEIWVEGYSAPTLEQDGSIIWHGILNDVTDRVRREKELAERERMISAINNAAPSLIILWDVRAGKAFYVNEGVRRVFGCAPEEMYALSHEEIFGKIHPDDLPQALEFTKRLRAARDGKILTHEYRCRNKQGEWRLMSSRDIVFERDAEGKVIKTLSVIDDVSERKFAVEALRKSEKRLQKLHRIVSDSNLDHKEKINRMLALGTQEFGVENGLLGEIKDQIYRVAEAVSLDDSIGVGFTCRAAETFCHEVLRNQDLLAIENVGATAWREHPAYAKSGAEVYLGFPVQNAGRIYGTLCFTSRTPHSVAFSTGDHEFLKLMAQWMSAELTRQTAEEALRKSEEQLLLAQKLESIGQLAGGIAHDFNNMLTAINGYSDLILRQVEETNPIRRSVEEIKKAGERSSALTQQLLAFSRKQILKPEILSINQAVSEIGTLLERLIGEDISLVTILDFAVKPVKVDPGQLSQVIVNLAVNARDAMPQGGTLTIETKNVYLDERRTKTLFGAPAGEYVMLSVSDTGVGMSEETMRHLFEPFFTTKETGKGTGLGLATVYGVIKQSDGYITVDSKPGAGAIFRIFLPSAEDVSVVAAEESGGENSKYGAETVLLVEDEEMVRNLAGEILQSCGYCVVEATNGAEAVEICEKNQLRIDLLLTDVVMPQMNGRELWEKLAEKRPQMKVLFTSGYTDDAILRTGVKNDEANFLQKPFSLDALVRKVREVLDAEEFSNNTKNQGLER